MATFRFVVMFSLNSFGYVFLFCFVITFHNKRFSSHFVFYFWFARMFRVSFLFACTFFVCQTLNVNFLISLSCFGLSLVLLFLFCFSYTILLSSRAVRDLNVFGSVKFGFLPIALACCSVLSVCLWHN